MKWLSPLVALGLIGVACAGTAQPVTTTLPRPPLTTTTAVVTTTTHPPPPTTTTTVLSFPYDFAVHPDAPVIKPGDWDSNFTAVPWVIVEEDVWKMFYSGASGRVSHLGLATSTDGVNWVKKENNPLFSPPPPGLGWFFIFETDEQWEMLYVAGFGPPFQTIYRATASDLEGPWEDRGIHFRAPNEGWNLRMVPTGVTKVGDEYMLAYAAYSDFNAAPTIGIMTSADGVMWESGADPIFTATEGSWDEKGVVPMNIIETANGLELFFLGFNEPPKVGYQQDEIPFGRLVSTDGGATWTADNDGGPIGSTGERGWPGMSVVYDGERYWLFMGDDLGGAGISLVTGSIP